MRGGEVPAAERDWSKRLDGWLVTRVTTTHSLVTSSVAFRAQWTVGNGELLGSIRANGKH